MENEERARRWETERQRQIKLGLRLELLDSIPEGTGNHLISELKKALEDEDREAVLAILKQVGDTIHARWGDGQPTRPMYEAGQEKYNVYLSSGTSGTRLFVNTRSYDQFPGDLIFPNVNLDHKQNGRTLADIFEELFGKRAENIQPDSDKPYYVVRMASMKGKK